MCIMIKGFLGVQGQLENMQQYHLLCHKIFLRMWLNCTMNPGSFHVNCSISTLLLVIRDLFVDLFQGKENETAELCQKLLKLEQETELLRDINRALREENVLLKDKLKAYEAETHLSKNLNSSTITMQFFTFSLIKSSLLKILSTSFGGLYLTSFRMFTFDFVASDKFSTFMYAFKNCSKTPQMA